MAIYCPDTAEILMLMYITNQIGTDGNAAPAGGHRLLRLFTSNTTPSDNTVIGGLTEASEAGYAPITLIGTNWTCTQSLGVTTAVYSEQTFTFTTGTTVYGYYVTSIEGTPKLLWLERFSGGPYTLPVTGGQIGVSPRLTCD